MSLGIAACEAEGDPFLTGSSIFSSFEQVYFEGATGHVLIDPSTGSRYSETMSYALLNGVLGEPDEDGIVHLQSILAAEYYGSIQNDTVASLWANYAQYNYSGMTTIPPDDLPPLEEDFSGIPLWGSIACIFVSGVIMLSAIAFGLWTWRNRDSPVVRASQPFFLFVLCVGVFIMAVPGITLVIESPPYEERFANISCMAVRYMCIS